MGHPVTEIRRIHHPSIDAFRRDHVAPGIPAILTGVTDAWPASRWTLESVRAEFGEVRIEVQKRPKGNGTEPERTESMTVREYLDLACSDRDDRRHYYFTTSRIPAPFERGLGSIPYALGDHRTPSLFFMGCESFTRLHFHPEGDAFTCQFAGNKRFVLYPPDQSRYLHMTPFAPLSGVIDPEKADPRKFPNLRHARGIECELRAGEVMFIPIHWWHVVYGSEFNVSVLYPSQVASWTRVWLPPVGWRGTAGVAARRLRVLEIAGYVAQRLQSVRR